MSVHFNRNGTTIAQNISGTSHPEIKGEFECGKPNQEMILHAINEFSVNPMNAILIGDKKSDNLAEEKAEIGKNLYIHRLLG